MERIWWERVPNAIKFLNDITNAMVNQRSVVIQHARPLPWHDYFMSLLRESVTQQDFSKTFEVVMDSDISDSGKALLQKYCEPEIIASYRPSKSPAFFLAERDDIIFHRRYFLVTIDSESGFDAWETFISDYIKSRGKRGDQAVFVLDYTGTCQTSYKKGITRFSYDSYIGEYDRTVFSMMASSSVNEHPVIRRYIAELAVNVIGDDIECYEHLMDNYSVFSDNPDAAMNPETGLTRDEMVHRVWLAQIKTVYPLIEEYRRNLVERRYSDISLRLPVKNGYGSTINDPGDIELGTLVFLVESTDMYLNQREFDKLKAYRNARNTLSHLGVLTIDEIRFLVE